ncbi:hypothetical protein [Candidatus Poriferisodalis sp.]|uniref:hypothetical protein n=1 Tax=Candidatus Poriferisodalis sp. TaxID=3101277 RepID=UPI003B52F21E
MKRGFEDEMPSRPPSKFRLLLDQGFPKTPLSMIEALDQSVDVTHLYDLDRDLSMSSTPDWYLYLVASQHNFAAFVTRDKSQSNQAEEMLVLSRLPTLSVVTWNEGIEDPIREWGQLLAYLPAVRKQCDLKGGRMIVLPKPRMSKNSFIDPVDMLGKKASKQKVSLAQIRHEAHRGIEYWARHERSDDSATQAFVDDLL